MLKFQHDILKEFRNLGAKTILFGSVARGDYRLDSDIDIAIVTDSKETREKAEKTADKILYEYGKVVSLKFFSKEEFREKQKQHDRLVAEILKGKVL